MTAEANIAVQTLARYTLSVPTAAVQSLSGIGAWLNSSKTVAPVPLPIEVIGTDGLNTVVQVAEAPGRTRAAAPRGADEMGHLNGTVAPPAAGTRVLIGTPEPHRRKA